jgi:hypothetical protein
MTKHIKEFDEFNPEDFETLDSLSSDMDSLGFQKPIQGKDWGYGPDLKGENDGNNILFINDKCKDVLIKAGVIEKKQNRFAVVYEVLQEMRNKLWNLKKRKVSTASIYSINEVDISELENSYLDKEVKVKTPEGFSFFRIRNDYNGRLFPLNVNGKHRVGKVLVTFVYEFLESKIKNLK